MKVDCPNCDCSFNETCFPVSLQCSHVYCIECVKKFTHNFTVEEISCPACVNPVRAPTNISECEQNTIILGLIKPEKADAKQAECSECDQMCSTSCIDCPKKPSMCSSCFTLMHQTAKRESHKLGPLVKQYTCSIHGKELDLICHSCSSAVCQLCVIVGSHVGHQVTFPADISQYTKKIPKAIQKFEQDVALSKQDLLEKQVVVAQQECNIEILKKAASCTDSIEFILQYGRMIPVEAKILMLGLDGSGKTTLLYHLVLEDVVTTIPTIGFNVETVVKQFHRFTIWDVGGQEKLRPLWRHYFSSTQGLIFVIDCSRRDRVEEAREELFGLLQKEGLRGIPVLVCANKQDIPGAMTVSELSEKLGLARISHLKYNILPVSSSAGEGLTAGLLWLASQTVC